MNRNEFLRILIELHAFRACPPLEATKFVSELEACGCRTNIGLLERFEQLGWEKPLAHLRYPKSNDSTLGGYYVYPRWLWDDMSRWLSDGFMRASAEDDLFKWANYRDENGRESGAPYYSQFQIYDLAEEISLTSLRENAAWIPTNQAAAEFDSWAAWSMRWAGETRAQREARARDAEKTSGLGASEVCQAIASRYYYFTQTDGRVIRAIADEEGWDWTQYCREWNAAAVAERLGISPEDVRQIQQELSSTASRRDPLVEWYDLLQYISIERKEKLKGAARYAQVLYSMEHMLRLFYQDLAGKEIEPARPHPVWRFGNGEAETHRHGEPRYLRFVANRYGVNPQPRLVLYVEGVGEAQIIPRLAEKRFDASLDDYGIVLRNLGSVSEFSGTRAEKKYGALRRSIEELHDLQIITFVLLDNEDKRIQRVKERLCTTPSSYRPERTITRRELVFVWKRSIEFDNFNDDEIARAMAEMADMRHVFSEDEVSSARSKFGKQKGDPLSNLYKDKLDYELNKPELLNRLFENLPADREPRPMDIIVDKILEFAALNHQPTMAYADKLNQAGGMLGHPVDESIESRMEARVRKGVEEGFEPLRKLEELLVSNEGGDCKDSQE